LDLVTIRSCREPYQAHLVRSLLESHGIRASVAHEHHVGLNWLYSTALGGVKVQVSSEDAEEARSVLAAEPVAAGPDDQPSEMQRDESSCPRCQSPDISLLPLERRTKAVSLGVGLPFVLGHDRWRCQSCGFDWRRQYPYRRLDHVLADLIALLVSAILWLLLIPIRVYRRFVGLLDAPSQWTYACWNCGREVRPAEDECPDCGINLPDETAFRDIIELGKSYDAQCPLCHTPYATLDYDTGASTWICSRCQNPL
jgi:transposase-like protein